MTDRTQNDPVFCTASENARHGHNDAQVWTYLDHIKGRIWWNGKNSSSNLGTSAYLLYLLWSPLLALGDIYISIRVYYSAWNATSGWMTRCLSLLNDHWTIPSTTISTRNHYHHQRLQFPLALQARRKRTVTVAPDRITAQIPRRISGLNILNCDVGWNISELCNIFMGSSFNLHLMRVI